MEEGNRQASRGERGAAVSVLLLPESTELGARPSR